MRALLVVQWLEHCTANLRATGSIHTRAVFVGFASFGSWLPFGHLMSQVWSVLRLNNSTAKQHESLSTMEAIQRGIRNSKTVSKRQFCHTTRKTFLFNPQPCIISKWITDVEMLTKIIYVLGLPDRHQKIRRIKIHFCLSFSIIVEVWDVFVILSYLSLYMVSILNIEFMLKILAGCNCWEILVQMINFIWLVI